jgi:AmiR/NasT family two-component response regulator
MITCPKCQSDEHLEYVEIAVVVAPARIIQRVAGCAPDVVVGDYKIDLANTMDAKLHCSECQIHFDVPDDARVTWALHTTPVVS